LSENTNRNGICQLSALAKDKSKQKSYNGQDLIEVTGKLTGNRRDVCTLYPKALFLLDDDRYIDRNHCWIPLTKEIEEIQPQGHQKPVQIGFKAKMTLYEKAESSEVKIGLQRIRDVRRILTKKKRNKR